MFAEPQVQRRQLPQFRTAQRCQLALRVSQQAIEHGRVGFKSGWVSSAAVQMVLKETELKVSHMAIGRILKALHYKQIGRANRGYLQEGGVQPNLWNLNDQAIVSHYARDQGYE